MNKPGKQKRIQIPSPDNHGEKSSQFKGVRLRKWGKWVSEVRMPNSRAKIWLGSYDTAEQAARAFDAAVYCLRGAHANFNFPNTVPDILSATSLSRQQIQLAAAKYARGEIPSTSKTSYSVLAEKPISSTLGMETLTANQLMSEELDFVLWESLLRHCDGNQLLNLDKFLSLDAATLELTSSTGEQGSIFLDPPELWNFSADLDK